MSGFSNGGWRPYIPVAERRWRAARKIAAMKKAGREISPVEITGRRIATTFWGEAWCKNLEAYSDYANRLPRGRTYVRNGSMLDLQIEAGRVHALVSGSELYRVEVAIERLKQKRWTEIKGLCGGQIDSLVELLQGSISGNVMEIVTRKGEGLFPSPREIRLACSCPDWATMCKHVAATLYAVGARLDHRPELLFTLRGVDPLELVESAIDQGVQRRKPRAGRVLETRELSSVFGVDIDMGDAPDTGGVSADDGTGSRGARGRSGKSVRVGQTGERTKGGTAGKKRKEAGGARQPRKATGRKPRAKTASAKKPMAVKTSTRSAPAKKRAAKRATSKSGSGAKKAAKNAAKKAARASSKKATRRPTR